MFTETVANTLVLFIICIVLPTCLLHYTAPNVWKGIKFPKAFFLISCVCFRCNRLDIFSDNE